MNDMEDGFDPDQLAELEKLMEQVVSDEMTGYQMVFWVSASAAKEMIDCYDNAIGGSAIDGALCMIEFGKIVNQLRQIVNGDEETSV